MKFTVKNLGKIREANIEVKPLTIFVGKNGTQKSYMAHVVYGINIYFFQKFVFTFAKNFIKLNTNKIEVSFLESVEEVLKNIKKPDFRDISNIFNSDKFKNIEVSVKDFEISDEDIKNLNEDLKKEKSFLEVLKFLEFATYLIPRDIENFDVIMEELIKNFSKKEIYYFPASRTGFILAFDDIMAGIFKERFSGKHTIKLTKPVIDFLSNFAEIKANRFIDKVGKFGNDERMSIKNKEQIKHLLSFLEERILKGQILEKKEEDRYTKFMFKPKNSDVELDIHIISSATIELLPLIEFLKNFSELDNKFLIIEEPEAHLHPKAQIEIARFLALLVNNGVNILITTHSDYIIHEISNCIKLFNLNEKEQKKFLKDEDLVDYPEVAISQDKVAVYLFKENEDRIDVEKLKVDKFGIEDKNFEDVVDELFERSTTLGEKLIEGSED